MNNEQFSGKKIVLAVTGASGSIYAKRLINRLSEKKISSQIDECGIVFSKAGLQVWKHEIGEFPDKFPFKTYKNNDFFAPFASGSAGFDTMIICPCSMGTIGKIAGGISDNLITRAADVILKERKKLIAVIRESPLSSIHLRNLLQLTNSGTVILPASPSFYSQAKNISELIDTVINRILDQAGFVFETKRWGKI